jgi:hypothetical protein
MFSHKSLELRMVIPLLNHAKRGAFFMALTISSAEKAKGRLNGKCP